MGFWSSVGSAFSSACSSLVSGVCSVARGAAALVREVGSMAVEGLSGVVSVIANIAKSLGFMKEDERPEDLGDQMLQAELEGVTLASCEGDYDAYMEKIRNFKVNPDKSKELTSKDKLTAFAVVTGARIEDHYGTSIAPLIPLIGRAPDFFNGGRLKSMLDKGLSIMNIGNYFSSNMDRKAAAPVEADLVKHEKTLSPESDEGKLRDMLRSMRE